MPGLIGSGNPAGQTLERPVVNLFCIDLLCGGVLNAQMVELVVRQYLFIKLFMSNC